MKRNSFSHRISRYLNKRFHGKFNKEIKDFKSWLKVCNKFSNIDNFYLSWYEKYVKEMIRASQLHLFIPIPNKDYRVSKKNLDKLIKKNTICLKDIVLPIPNSRAGYSFYISGIIESLWTYLLDNLDEETRYSIFPVYMEGAYEYKHIQLEKGNIVIDAGANIGEFSALAEAKGCKAYAFEPMPYVIDNYLSKTVELNPNITICNYALSDKRDTLEFTIHTADMSASSYVMNQYIMHSDTSTKVKVQAIDLDTFVEENKLPRVDFIKADIEGAERYMLMGAKRVLKEFAPKIAICKYHLKDDPQVLRELILNANPNYVIEEKWKKIYAYVPKSTLS